MSESTLIYNALCLPATDVEALIQGRMIAAMPRKFINPGQKFALYPADISLNLLPPEQYYRSSFLPIAQSAIAQTNSQGVLMQPKQLSLIPDQEQLQLPLLASEAVLIKAWAKCELCQIVNEPEPLKALSQLTIWTTEALQQILSQRPHIFLAYLRVYLLPKPFEIPTQPQNRHFVPLPKSQTVSGAKPILSDRIFNIRQHQLQNLQPPLHPQLEELQSALISLATTNPAAKQLEQDIKVFLGWSSEQFFKQIDSNLAWINHIAQVGNSSDGNEFERLVRKSFIKLGFSCSNTNPKANLDPEKLGGSGGLDFYCESPYPVVGECKATKTEKVTDGTAAQLIKLGYKNLQQQYNSCIKIIMAAGELNEHALLTTVNNEINVIRPETLQTLVELKHNYPGCIDLLELKQCLEQKPFGDNADSKINSYINNILQNIKLRSHIIKAVKELGESERGYETVEIRVQYNAVFAKELTLKLEDEAAHDLLIELSSPLTGYLGRIKGKDWRSDRFYFLRDLPAS